MHSWWPWSRPKKTASNAPAPSSTGEPAWQRLPVMQRTFGGIEPTARLKEFKSSLTTSQNPGSTSPMSVLSDNHPEQIPVLQLIRESIGAAVQRTSSPPIPIPRPRTWLRNAPAGRGAHLGPSPVVQRAEQADDAVQDLPSIETVDHISPEFDAPTSRSLVEAEQPLDDHRTLEVVPDASERLVTDDPLPLVPDDVAGTTGEQPAAAGAEPALGYDAVPIDVPASVQSSAENLRPLSAATENRTRSIQPVPSVRRISTPSRGSDSVTDARMTVMRQTDSPQPAAARQGDENATTRATTAVLSLQRSHVVRDRVDPAPVSVAKTATEKATSEPPQTHEQPLVLPLPQERHSVTTTPAQTAQRVAEPAEPLGAAAHSQLKPLPALPEPEPVRAVVQRLKASAAPTASPGIADVQPPRGNTKSLQRASNDTASPSPARAAASTASSPDTRACQPEPATPSPPVPLDVADPAPTGSVVQRLEAPMEARPPLRGWPTTTVGSSPTRPAYSDGPTPPVVQRYGAVGRLVVLPPVRSITTPSRHEVADTPSPPTRSVLFESPRPMSLQRMFEHTARREETAIADGVTTPAPPSEQPAHTITFTPASIQREPDSETTSLSMESEVAPVPPAPAAATSPASSAPGGGDLEELVNRIYDPLAARLRAELWLDRERAGVLMELDR